LHRQGRIHVKYVGEAEQQADDEGDKGRLLHGVHDVVFIARRQAQRPDQQEKITDNFFP